MRHMDRERESSASRQFLQVTPEMRRALEQLAAASITLLDEIDAPVDGLEADEDFEVTFEDDEANGDHEPNHGWSNDGGCLFGPDDDREPNLGWTNDGDTTGGDADEDLAGAETSGGFPLRTKRDPAAIAEAKARFDPRLALRPEPPPREWIEHPNGLRFAPGAWTSPTIPAFPQDAPGRAACITRDEIRRLNNELTKARVRRHKKRGKSNG